MMTTKVETIVLSIALSCFAHTYAAQVGACHDLCFLAPVYRVQEAGPRLLLSVAADRQLGPGLWPAIRAEIANLEIPGISGVDFEPATEPVMRTSEFVVSVHLMGACNMNSGNGHEGSEPLGYVRLADGKIAPSMSVNCDAIVRAIEQLGHDAPMVRRNLFLARAIVRVIQHELRHILEQSPDHLTTGVFKAYLHSTELIAQ